MVYLDNRVEAQLKKNILVTHLLGLKDFKHLMNVLIAESGVVGMPLALSPAPGPCNSEVRPSLALHIFSAAFEGPGQTLFPHQMAVLQGQGP